jgi:hypothetical protein
MYYHEGSIAFDVNVDKTTPTHNFDVMIAWCTSRKRDDHWTMHAF